VRRALILGVFASLVAAAPASAAPATVHGLDTLTWDTPDVAVTVGDTVTWTFAGTAQAHHVANQGSDINDAGWATFSSPLGVPAPDATYTFSTPGVYKFYCSVHPTTMFGTVTVGTADAPPPPPAPPRVIPLSEQPFTNDSPALPATSETVTLDTTKPRLSSVSARRSGHRGARLRFRVSEESVVDVRLKRGGKTVKRYAAAGTGTLAFTAKSLKAGRYRVEVRAYDVAGNASSMKRVSLTVR
jgi:plastocyanin